MMSVNVVKAVISLIIVATGLISGEEKKVFTTIQSCVDQLQRPGDECKIPPGTYREVVTIRGKHGTPDKPMTITGAGDETTVIDGTLDIKPSRRWRRYKGADERVNGKRIRKPIYKARIEQDIWQLFVDGEMMTNARWPNALWSDKTVFNGSYWAGVSKETKKGLIVDNGKKNLAGSGLNATGAVAILNIGSFNTFNAIVKSHAPGSDRFTYDDTFNNNHFKASKSIYFLEDKLEFLDQAGEWFYDKNTKMLYIWAYDGGSVKDRKITGKVRTYSFTVTNCTNVIIQNLKFHATTLKANSNNPLNDFVGNLTFSSNIFNYPSYSKRMLGVAAPAEWTFIGGYARLKKAVHWGTFTFFNNTFFGSDGVAIQFIGKNVRVENNLFEYNDWTAANTRTFSGGISTIYSKGVGEIFVRNTLRYNGASAGYRPGGANPTVQLNHFHHQCWGLIQNDGAHVQCQIGAQTNALLEQNWVHDSPKYGLRFDGQPPRVGQHGTMQKNVAWNCNGLMVKGNYHQVYNNLGFDKQRDITGDKQGDGCMLCVLKYVRENPVPINNGTIIEYNVADIANGGKHNKKTYSMAGKVIQYNLVGSARKKYNIRLQVMDADNLDFRPTKNSDLNKHKAGPYMYDERATKYWIPGRQEYKACTPVPPDGSITVKNDRDALMWLNGYAASTHHVFLGKNSSLVEKATRESPEYKGSVVENGNIYRLADALERGVMYFWRIDAEVDVAKVYKGDVWSFKLKS